MFIQKVSYLAKPYLNNNTAKTQQNKATNPLTNNKQEKLQAFAYRDFNISFNGRTPENFYEQEFNRNNMPDSMKIYLNENYELRRHMPPEQMLYETFKYLDFANNFDEVKIAYPEEERFENLHPLGRKNGEVGVLQEIRDYRPLGETPLLKDGSEDLGMYILKKIYLEGKTIKEIDKDFRDKDLNDEYRKVITSHITNDTTQSYGIKFPKRPFWHSFIATREEYKKFFLTLPKTNTQDGQNRVGAIMASRGNSTSSTSQAEAPTNNTTPKKPTRKYTLQDHKKRQIRNDIKSNNGNVEKVIRRRFTANDPEASFIIKYISPIMTIAAERIHLSEEMKYFTEKEETNSTKQQKPFLDRFWKANPDLLDYYSQAITDTIELFENTYEAGGMIPINNNYEVITKNTPNQKVIDYVNSEFIDLLNYTQEIKPIRDKKYQEHDKLQLEWENHFLQRYGNPETNNELEVQNASTVDAQTPTTEFSEELLAKSAEKYNSSVFKLKGKTGDDILVTVNLDEVYTDAINLNSKIFPSRYAAIYKNDLLNNPKLTEEYKLAVATFGIRDMLDDERILPIDKYEDLTTEFNFDFYLKYVIETLAASSAMSDILCKYGKNEVSPNLYELYPTDFNMLEAKLENGRTVQEILTTHKKELNELYSKYTQQISPNEQNKISLELMQELLAYEPSKDSVISKDDQELILMLKEGCKDLKFKKKMLRKTLSEVARCYTHSKGILNKDLNPQMKTARFEQLMKLYLGEFMAVSEDTPPMLLSFVNHEVFNKHIKNLSPELKTKLEQQMQHISIAQNKIFRLTNNELIDMEKTTMVKFN